MASGIPARRVTRVTRSAARDNENANARPSRIATRTKPPSTTTAPTMSSKQSALSEVNTQNKRKREALGEVTGKSVNNRVKSSIDVKGKGKESAIAKPVKSAAPAAAPAASRQPLRTVATRTRSATQSKTVPIKEVPVVTHAAPKRIPVVEVPTTAHATRRTTTRSATAKATATNVAPTRRTTHKRAPVIKVVPEIEDEPMSKRRRTSDDEPMLEKIPEETEAPEPIEHFEVENVVPTPAPAPEIVVEQRDWDDLDREDDADPLMVSEYVADIFNYLKTVEQTTMPNPNYMENQKELAWKMRGILMDWLIQVHTRFKLLPETLFLCVNLIDRFLSARVVSLAKLQLVGVTCMFIAAKVEETIAPSVTNFIYCADSTYNEQEILQAERYILKTLEWNLSYPCPLNFLRRISKADDYNVQVRTIGKYLIEVGCLEWRLLAAPPSLLAAASMWLARLILDCPDWTPNLRHFSSYPEEALLPTANLILNYILKPISHESFFKKYASKRFMKASVYVREWALERWEERTMVDLAVDLPHLKEEARRRAAELLALQEGRDEVL